jgi:hypothetical protein
MKERLIRYSMWAALLLSSLLICRWLLFVGPVQKPATFSTGEQFMDMHAHIAGIGAGDSGCFVSSDIKDSFKFDVYLRAFGITRKDLEREGDQILARKISESISASRLVDSTVILAMDGIVTKDGQLDRKRTEIYVPNEFVYQMIQKYSNLRFGASVNPYRPDALERLEKVASQGALLIKWIPPIQLIDPADEGIRPFYEKMKELNLALLSHTGNERTFTFSVDEYGDPRRLKLPLEVGVKVIAAHVGTTGSTEGLTNVEHLMRMFPVYPNLYADISTLTQINKMPYFRQVFTDKRALDRYMYGSDFPLINTPLVSPLYFLHRLTFAQIFELFGIENLWDRDIKMKQMLGFSHGQFLRSAAFFKVPEKPNPGSK